MSVLAVIGTYRHRIDTIVCFSDGWKSGFVLCKLNKVQACTLPSFPFFFWAVWASGNDALKAEITTLVQIRLLTDFLCSQKHSKVSFELPEGFSVTAEKWQQQGMFWVTQNLTGYSPKALLRLLLRSRATCSWPAVIMSYSLCLILYFFLTLSLFLIFLINLPYRYL